MDFKKSVFALLLGSVGMVGAIGAHAVDLNTGDRLTIASGVQVLDANGDAVSVSSGSFFALDLNGNGSIESGEKNALTQGSTGIVIGATYSAPGEISALWPYYGQPGYEWVSTSITGGTDGLDMSGWMVTWGSEVIGLGTGAWQVLNASSGMPIFGYANGTALFSWNGVYGDPYTLDYTATVQSEPFRGFKYALHLEGKVVPVPEASTYGMMLAGLGLVGIAAARRRKHSEAKPFRVAG